MYVMVIASQRCVLFGTHCWW